MSYILVKSLRGFKSFNTTQSSDELLDWYLMIIAINSFLGIVLIDGVCGIIWSNQDNLSFKEDPLYKYVMAFYYILNEIIPCVIVFFVVTKKLYAQSLQTF